MTNYFHRRRLLLFIGALVVIMTLSFKKLAEANLKFTLRRLDLSFKGDIVFNKMDANQKSEGIFKQRFVSHSNSDSPNEPIIGGAHLMNRKETKTKSVSRSKAEQAKHYNRNSISQTVHSDRDLTSPCIKPIKHKNALQKFDPWIIFQRSLKDYAVFHRLQIERIKNGDSNVTTLSYVCYDPVKCSGIGDQVYRILQTLLLAMASNRVMLLDWDEVSLQTFQHLIPNQIEWNFKPIQSTAYKIRNKKKFSYYSLLKDINNDAYKHIQISTVLQVPFSKGLSQLMAADKKKIFSKLALNKLCKSKSKFVSCSVVAGELLRYLFSFSQKVLLEVNEAQKIMGIYNTSYIAVHIRTGFFGTQYQEVGKFNKQKIFRTENTWYSTLNCSLALSKKSPAQMPLYLATDSYLVKKLALKEYGNQVRSLNMTLQHVAIPLKKREDLNNASSLLGVDGFMATWIDFLLLARSETLVRSTSGFSTLAGTYCSVGRQYYTPRCSKSP